MSVEEQLGVEWAAMVAARLAAGDHMHRAHAVVAPAFLLFEVGAPDATTRFAALATYREEASKAAAQIEAFARAAQAQADLMRGFVAQMDRLCDEQTDVVRQFERGAAILLDDATPKASA